jgi:AcrR family transcriptional regulator
MTTAPSADRPTPGTPPRGAAHTRERILAAATARFAAQGIRATSADRIIDDAGITKVTFYRHFPTKSELVVAYLQAQSAAEQAWMLSTQHDGAPLETLRALAGGIGAASCLPGFRGCPFINAAAEFADPDDPVRTAVAAHRDWTLARFAAVAEEAGVPDVDAVARQLLLLRDGAMVNGYLGDPERVGAALEAAFTSVIRAAIGSGENAGSARSRPSTATQTGSKPAP